MALKWPYNTKLQDVLVFDVSLQLITKYYFVQVNFECIARYVVFK